MSILTGRSSGRGFTLIELLIALALVSLISILVFSGLRLGTKTWESVDSSTNRTDAVRLAHGFLVRTLNQLRPLTATFDGETKPVFGGDAEQVEFVAPLSDHVGLSGLYVLRLSVEDQGAGRTLVLTRWLLHPDALKGGDGFPAWEPIAKEKAGVLEGYPVDMDAAGGAFGRTPLLDAVDTFEVAYYGVPDGETDPDWHKDWLDQANLPTLLRIRATTTSQSWPDITIALPTQP
jgi:general secretion pathway protein J